MWPTKEVPWRGSFVRNQANALRALGVHVCELTFDGRASWMNYARAILRLRALIHDQDFDLIHAHYGLTGAIALLQRRLPVVTTFHGSDTGYVRWQGYISWAVARLSAPIFVAAAGARQLGVEDPVVVPCGVETEFFVPIDRNAARRKLGWRQDATYVLLPGARSNPVKRADVFDATVEVLRETIPDVRAVSLEGRSREDTMHVFNAVDVTLMTSDSEGSPVAVKESLACTTPVVSVAVGDVPETLKGLPGCAVVSRNPKVLAESVHSALEAGRPPELRERAERYSSRRVAERIAAVYETVIRLAR